MAQPTTTAPVLRLREFLQSDAPARERSVAAYMAIVGLGVSIAAAVLTPVLGSTITLRLLAVIVPFCAYSAAVYFALRAGWYHPAIAWVNVLIETSIPLPVFYVDLTTKGAVYALTSPPIAFWAALIMFSALRASRGLALLAGAVAATEYLLFYFLLVRPLLPADAPITLSAPLMVTRALLLFAAGVGGAIVTHALLRKAEQALSAVRAQDLMSKYLLHELLGRGGMAEVHRATYCPEGGFEKIVAVKRVLETYSADERFTELFRFEAQICSRLSHPNIVQVLDIGKFAGTYVLAMEYVDGVSLMRLLHKGGALPLQAATYLAAELAAALDYLHQAQSSDGKPLGLVHRDVNPPNVLISRIGEVKLSDFGVVRAATLRDERPGVLVGKPGYLSPEQVEAGALDARADLYCLGLTLHEALTGERLLRGKDAPALRAEQGNPLPPPSVKRPDVPPELDAVVMRLLERDPARRFTRGLEVQDALSRLPLAAAPYPHGRRALMLELRVLLGIDTQPPEGAPTPGLSEGDAPTQAALPSRSSTP